MARSKKKTDEILDLRGEIRGQLQVISNSSYFLEKKMAALGVEDETVLKHVKRIRGEVARVLETLGRLEEKVTGDRPRPSELDPS